jgi:hypothetical protein
MFRASRNRKQTETQMGVAAGLSRPGRTILAADREGNIYVVDSADNEVLK